MYLEVNKIRRTSKSAIVKKIMNNEIFFDIRTNVCDWSGQLLNPKIKDAVSINNFVRICVMHDSGYAEAIYVLVTAVDGSEKSGNCSRYLSPVF